MHTFHWGVVGAVVASTSIVVVARLLRPEHTDRRGERLDRADRDTHAVGHGSVGGLRSRSEHGGRLACSAALPDDLVADLVPGLRCRRRAHGVRTHRGTEAFIPGAGGRPRLTNGVAPLDDHVPGRAGDPVVEAVRLSVLPTPGRAHSARRRHRRRGTAPVRRERCRPRVLHGGRGRRQRLGAPRLRPPRVQDSADATPEQAQRAFDALLSAVVEKVSGSSLGDRIGRHHGDDDSLTSCDAGNVNAVTAPSSRSDPS